MTTENEEILSSIKSLRKKYKTEMDDSPDTAQMSFIDELNDLIRKIFKDDPTDVYTALTPGELEKWKKNKFKRFLSRLNLQKIFYFILLVTITAFLVSEAVSFYAGEGSSNAKTYLKAILTEVCFIFLSGYRASGVINTILVSALRVAVFCLMLFVISSSVVTKSTQDISEINKISEQIALLENQIRNKEDTIKFYMEKGWGVSVNKHEKEKTELLNQLIILKNKQQEGKSIEVSKTIEYKSYGSAAFRVILLLISMLITRRLFKF